jgi:Tol biopolymer transport system component
VLDFAISPDGTSIVYVARDNAATVLWRISSDGTGRTRLTPPASPAVYTDPAWSPAGDAILYTRRDFVYLSLPVGATLAPGAARPPAIGVPRIWAMRPDGTPLREIYGVGDETGEGPIWSPDGASVAFRAGGAGGLTDLAITNFASTAITVPIGSIAHMSWSPDGRRLAYDVPAPTGGGRSQINLISADGSGQKLLLDDTVDSDTAPVWSPDGTVLAFLRRARGTPAADAVGAVFEVWTATPDGKLGQRLFGSDGRASEALAWSPDGQMLAATRYTVTGAAARGVWVVGADGSRARELVKDATHPTWVPHVRG